MFIRNFQLGYLLGLCLLFTACSYRIDKLGGLNGLSRPTAEAISRVSYGDVARIFQTRCTMCHGRGSSINLESLDGAKGAIGRIYQSTLVTRRMPKSPQPPLSRAELMTIYAWVEAGGPDRPLGGGSGTILPPLPPLVPTFDSIKASILDRKCISCHRVGGSVPRMPLVTIKDLINSPDEIVIVGDPDQSGLVISLLPGARKFMPPKDSGFAPVSPEEIDVIRKWIKDLKPGFEGLEEFQEMP